MSNALVPYKRARQQDYGLVRTPPRSMRAANVRARNANSTVSFSRRGLNRRGVASKETGFVDSTSLIGPVFNFNTTGSIGLIAEIQTGASVNQRIGKKILLKSVQCRGYVYANTTAGYNDCAILLVYDRRPTGSLPAVTDILVTADANALNNDANSGRFQIIKRMDFALVGNTGAGPVTSTTAMSADFFADMKMRPAVYKAIGTGEIGDIEEGAVYIVTVGSVAAGTAAASAYLNMRLRWVDI